MTSHTKANLFVVGAMKAGTTSFIDVLQQHPQLYVSPIKEPHYFIAMLPKNLYTPSRYFNISTYLEKEFPAPLHIANVKEREQYDQLFSLGEDAMYRVDASTAYLHAQESAKLIKAYNAEAKIIILLRDPIQRAFSHYTMDVGLGRTARSFEAILQEEVQQYRTQTLPWNSYLGMSFYNKAVERFQNEFDDVQVIRFESLIKNRSQQLKEVAAFLGISPFNVAESTHKNESRTIKHAAWLHWLTKLGIKDVLSKVLGSTFKQKLFKAVSSKKSKEIPLSTKLRQEIEALFHQESSYDTT